MRIAQLYYNFVQSFGCDSCVNISILHITYTKDCVSFFAAPVPHRPLRHDLLDAMARGNVPDAGKQSGLPCKEVELQTASQETDKQRRVKLQESEAMNDGAKS